MTVFTSKAKGSEKKKMSTKLAFNSYTVREKLKDPESVERTFRQLRDVGYEAVELDLDRLLLQFSAGDLKDLLDRLNLQAFSAHTGFERLEHGIEDVISGAKVLGLEYVVVPSLPRDLFCKDEQGYLAGTRMLSSFQETMTRAGIQFAYHNHAKEFEKFRGRTAMEIIFNESNWKNYLAEIDIYWVQYAGGDPAAWIRKYRGHVPLAHIKDLGIVDGRPMTMEVGEGNINLPSVLDACRESGVQWYIVEQDDTLRDSVESLRISKAFLENMGIS